MKINELIDGLRNDLEWARANEWETPIMLGDHIAEAIAVLEGMLDGSECEIRCRENQADACAGGDH